jgi:uncharacterized membrane protein YdjX (TVP38/TMEM64 family)
MRKDSFGKIWALFVLFLAIALFVFLSYLVEQNFSFFESVVGIGFWGLFVYFVLNVFAIVFAPLTVFPLIAIVTGVWGWVVAGFVSWLAWLVGASLAFLVGRHFGVMIAEKFVSIESLYKFEERFSVVGSFWGIVFLRMVIPVDILSYGLGIFSRVGFWKHFFASAFGLIPVTFLIAYLGEISIVWQVVVGLGVLIGFLVVLIWREIFAED